MFRIIQNPNYDAGDVSAFIETLAEKTDGFFEKNSPVFIARAPGRLDVMGGIADYSGSLVLEMPIAEAVFAALQKSEDPTLKIQSLGENSNEIREFEMTLADFKTGENLIEYSAARAYFAENAADHWAGYVAGVFLVLMRERGIEFSGGARIFIASGVPQGKGVSSSAALEAAVMSAVAAAFNVTLKPRETALLCQKTENLIVGAPCGVMDQMSVVCGKKDELLALVCQPAELKNPVKIPDEIAFWGIDSGIRHAVVGADYGSVRTGAFIGYRIIADLLELEIEKSETQSAVKIKDEKFRGYLANITPADFEENFAARLPQEISGADFLARYSGTTDTVTKVSPEKIYQVFRPAAHAVYENARVRKFAALLGKEMSEENLNALGELMFSSHASYSACGLGSDGTDLLVELVKKIGRGRGLFGARITGGGSGGTVAVSGLKNAGKIIEQITGEYAGETAYQPYIFKGSSTGAADFGFLEIVFE
jgi:L-arabinokinase